MPIVTRISFALSGLLAAAGPASAQFAPIVPDGSNFPWVRGETERSSYTLWDDFCSAGGPNPPELLQLVGADVSDGFEFVAPGLICQTLLTDPSVFDEVIALADLVDLGAPGNASRILSSGNLYSPTGVVIPAATVPSTDAGPGATTTILLQVTTLGLLIDPMGVFADGVAPVEVQELGSIVLGDPTVIGGGFLALTFFRFELEGSADSHLIEFAAEGPNVSIARVDIDVFVEPPACPVDLDGDGVVGPGDVTAFVAAFQAGEAAADADGNGAVNNADIFAFAEGFLDPPAGC